MTTTLGCGWSPLVVAPLSCARRDDATRGDVREDIHRARPSRMPAVRDYVVGQGVHRGRRRGGVDVCETFRPGGVDADDAERAVLSSRSRTRVRAIGAVCGVAVDVRGRGVVRGAGV